MKKGKLGKDPIQVFNITMGNNSREYKGIDEWRRALKSAENKTNPRRKLLYELYDEIMLDTHLGSVTEKRILNVLNKKIIYLDKSGKENELINTIMEQAFFEEMIREVINSRFQGYSLFYIKSLSEEFSEGALIPRAHVIPSKGIVVKNPNDENGINYTKPPYSNCCISAGKPNDLGLFIRSAPMVIFKKGGVSDWALFAEFFGQPLRKGTYHGNDHEGRLKLEQALEKAGVAPWVVTPENTNIELIESKGKSGTVDLFERLGNFLDKQNSKNILCNTMTTDAEGGNYKGEVHAESEKAVAEADKRFVINILNTQFKQALEFFGIKADGKFSFENKKDLSIEDLNNLSNLIDIPEDYIYEKFSIPKPSQKEKKTKEPKLKPKSKTLKSLLDFF